MFETTGQVLCDVLPCYGGTTEDLYATIEKQLCGVGCLTLLQAMRAENRERSRNSLDMYLYCADGGPDEASYKRINTTMTWDDMNIIFETSDCFKHKVFQAK
jgi:hypothetical protein